MPIITNPQATDPQNNPSHSQLHRDEIEAIIALEGNIKKKFTKDIAREIEDLTEKTTLHNDDLILIEDSEDIYNKKKVKKSNLSTNLSKATGSDIDTGTDNDKYVTPKAIADSKVFSPTSLDYFNAPQGFLINGKIVRTVDSGNMTFAIKTLAGNDPSATDPVYCRIGNTVRSITSALSVTLNATTK